MTYGFLTYLAAAAAMTAVDAWHDFAEKRERARQATAMIYAPVSQVRWQIETGRLLIVVAVSRKLEPCSVPRGAPVTLVGRWSEDRSTRFKSYPAFTPDGDMVEGAPLVLRGEEFLVGPFVIEDKPETLRKIESVSVRFPCEFASGITRTATIGPLLKP
ncbi:hypothetical protein [Zhengella mangrovi]|uniref:hypothetical protein n=1 Tax=Zhengella mangrovi TaxID=1982044 RepID=UPI001055B512|nr:hypothetical protein [Zhengella mangrovi]